MEVKRAGGVAAILGNPFNEIQVIPFLNPATVTFLDGLNTLLTEKHPTATLVPGNTMIGTKPAPVIAPFSSKGQNVVDPNILKFYTIKLLPDITAPGFNILPAWSEASSPLKMPEDRRVVKYNMQSGTSMSCPHVSAVIAPLKSIHPDWTTIDNAVGRPIKNATGDDANPFEYGSGHFRPSKAADP
ncbi:hypothetical protein KY290_014348 [Solanum tuberosum]|uniref:Peptidase S8/S53 domain-containing protein n=1 Tax=Solanum tuberosum TaxID=4113 RepID=A0ABQ7VPC2_SOLTU|nr:hypothetical protein KY289_014413 [Solanum tuberosum]KAH0770367.1 hypothetical protein KY290_014348 [Solanum tuberosum]